MASLKELLALAKSQAGYQEKASNACLDDFHENAGLQTATFCGQQGRISRTVRAILNGQPGISAGQRVLRPTDQY